MRDDYYLDDRTINQWTCIKCLADARKAYMARTGDYIFASQLCTVISMAMMYVAHLIEAGHILNPNWNFASYLLLGTAVFFMALPHILYAKDKANF